MSEEKEPVTKRRSFLKAAAVTAPAAVAVASTVGTMEVQAAPAVDPTSDKLQDTAHTRAYYDSARF